MKKIIFFLKLFKMSILMKIFENPKNELVEKFKLS
jgi:hypothetical protein